MEDYTLKMIWALWSIARTVEKPFSLTETEIKIGDFKYFHSTQRLDESLADALGHAHAYYKDKLHPEMNQFKS